MQSRLSVLMITKNAAETLATALASVRGLADEIIVVDDFSVDATKETALKFGARFIEHRQETFGSQRAFGLSECSGRWVLMLDADEAVGDALKHDIRETLEKPTANGYRIPFKNHFLGHELSHGGETYSKLVLFRKDKTKIVSDIIHEKAEVEGKVETLRQPILHYSYRSLGQTFSKFRRYAAFEAERKYREGEHSDIGKLITYPAHMFWSRYITDGGYRDHFSRILLDIGFAYMEFLTYLFLLQKKEKKA